MNPLARATHVFRGALALAFGGAPGRGPTAFPVALQGGSAPSSIVAAPAGAVPPLGPSTKRVNGLSIGDASWANAQAEKLFGPFNPRYVPDWVLKRMDTDWTIGFCNEIWRSGFGAVDYFLDGGDAEIRAGIEDVIRPRAWAEKLLQARKYGRQTCEVVWGAREIDYRYPDESSPGKTILKRMLAYVVEEMRDLDPEMVELLPDALGDFAGIDYGGAKIEPDRLIHVVNEPEFGSLCGRAQGTRAYIPWWRGNMALLMVDRYLERKGDPPIVGFAPSDVTTDENGNTQDPVKVTAIGLANLRSSSSYVFPQEYDPQSNQPLYAVRTLEVANRAPEFLQVIEHHEKNKRLACLIPGGLGEGGSFASDKVAQQMVDRFFDRHLQALVLAPLNRHLLPRLAAVNFPGSRPSDVPTLRAGSMSLNARQDFFELVRSALALDGVAPDGKVVKIAQMVDWMDGLRKGNVRTVAPSLIPEAPKLEIGGPPAPGYPTAGQPPRIAPERDRPDAPGRPGQVSLAKSAPDLEIAKPGDLV